MDIAEAPSRPKIGAAKDLLTLQDTIRRAYPPKRVGTPGSFQDLKTASEDIFMNALGTDEGKKHESAVRSLAQELQINSTDLESAFLEGLSANVRVAQQLGILSGADEQKLIERVIGAYALSFRKTLKEFKKDSQPARLVLEVAKRAYMIEPDAFFQLRDEFKHNENVDEALLRVSFIDNPENPRQSINRSLETMARIQTRYQNNPNVDVALIRKAVLFQPEDPESMIERALLMKAPISPPPPAPETPTVSAVQDFTERPATVLPVPSITVLKPQRGSTERIKIDQPKKPEKTPVMEQETVDYDTLADRFYPGWEQEIIKREHREGLRPGESTVNILFANLRRTVAYLGGYAQVEGPQQHPEQAQRYKIIEDAMRQLLDATDTIVKSPTPLVRLHGTEASHGVQYPNDKKIRHYSLVQHQPGAPPVYIFVRTAMGITDEGKYAEPRVSIHMPSPDGGHCEARIDPPDSNGDINAPREIVYDVEVMRGGDEKNIIDTIHIPYDNLDPNRRQKTHHFYSGVSPESVRLTFPELLEEFVEVFDTKSPSK